MENIRLILIVSHVLITIILIYQLHPYLSPVENSPKHKKQSSLIIDYINNLFRISLYHSSCIVAIWYSSRYGAGMICATGILLIGDLLQIITIAIQYVIETDHVAAVYVFLDVINIWLFLAAIIITFILAKKISKHQKDFMQVELLTTSISETSMDGRGEFSIV